LCLKEHSDHRKPHNPELNHFSELYIRTTTICKDTGSGPGVAESGWNTTAQAPGALNCSGKTALPFSWRAKLLELLFSFVLKHLGKYEGKKVSPHALLPKIYKTPPHLIAT